MKDPVVALRAWLWAARCDTVQVRDQPATVERQRSVTIATGDRSWTFGGAPAPGCESLELARFFNDNSYASRAVDSLFYQGVNLLSHRLRATNTSMDPRLIGSLVEAVYQDLPWTGPVRFTQYRTGLIVRVGHEAWWRVDIVDSPAGVRHVVSWTEAGERGQRSDDRKWSKWKWMQVRSARPEAPVNVWVTKALRLWAEECARQVWGCEVPQVEQHSADLNGDLPGWFDQWPDPAHVGAVWRAMDGWSSADDPWMRRIDQRLGLLRQHGEHELFRHGLTWIRTLTTGDALTDRQRRDRMSQWIRGMDRVLEDHPPVTVPDTMEA